jgi:hypothetical protein
MNRIACSARESLHLLLREFGCPKFAVPQLQTHAPGIEGFRTARQSRTLIAWNRPTVPGVITYEAAPG